MAIKVISYDLNKPGQDYDGLYDTIKSYASWAHPMKSIWFVSTSKTTNEVYKKIAALLDKGDHIFVHSWPTYCQGWLSTKIWEWVDAHK